MLFAVAARRPSADHLRIAAPAAPSSRWQTADGDFVDVDFAGDAKAPRHLALFHGLEGCSDSHYARAVAAHAASGVARRDPALARLLRRAEPQAAGVPLGTAKKWTG